MPQWGIYPKVNHGTTIFTEKCCCVVYNNNKLEINNSLFIKYITVHPYMLISYSLERVVEKK